MYVGAIQATHVQKAQCVVIIAVAGINFWAGCRDMMSPCLLTPTKACAQSSCNVCTHGSVTTIRLRGAVEWSAAVFAPTQPRRIVVHECCNVLAMSCLVATHPAGCYGNVSAGAMTTAPCLIAKVRLGTQKDCSPRSSGCSLNAFINASRH